MLAKQYSISLPADYDMDSIRDRVAKRGSTYDTLEHLGFKAFLITEKGKNDNQENSYAPFYVWQAEQGMLDFFCGDKFKGLTESFGWPVVRVWTIIDVGAGNIAWRPTFATRELVHLAPHSDLDALRSAELAAQQNALQSPHVHARVVALDPSTWTLVRFTLWDAPLDLAHTSSIVQGYQVLHLSAPMFAVPVS
jgi:uncharacterized protein DUF4865